MIEHNVREFGALGNGIEDDAIPIQLAIDTQASNGGFLYFPPGIYAISRPLTISGKLSAWRGHSMIPYAMDWDNDWQKRMPSYFGVASVIQYQTGTHGPIVAAGRDTHASFEGITFRCGQGRTEDDSAFSPPPRKCAVFGCRFENLDAAFRKPEDWIYEVRAHHNRFIGLRNGFEGKIYDSSIEANVFTSCLLGVQLCNSAANRISENRFEWSDRGIAIWGGRDAFLTANEFDSCKCSITIAKARNIVISGSLFRRSGAPGWSTRCSHILIDGGENLGVAITGNSFSQCGEVITGENQRPKHIIEARHAGGSHIIWSGNDSYAACTEIPICDRAGDSMAWIDDASGDRLSNLREIHRSRMGGEG